MRLFVAIDVGAEIRARLMDVARQLRKEAPDAKWLTAEAMHVTLAFLGDVEAELLPGIADAVRRVATEHAPLLLTARGAGAFGPSRRPRVLWIGLGGALAELSAIQTDLDGALAPIRRQEERRSFTPHLTLARARHPRGDPALARCVTALTDADLGSVQVSELVLYQSDLSAEGARHTAICRALLARDP